MWHIFLSPIIDSDFEVSRLQLWLENSAMLPKAKMHYEMFKRPSS